MMTERPTTGKTFADRLTAAPVLGPFCKTIDPAVIEALGYGGFDFVVLDLEHGPASLSQLSQLIRACECSGLTSVVRVKSVEQIGAALDLGAVAVQVPHVTSAEQAQRAVAASRFGQGGNRGVCRYVRAARSGTADRDGYFEAAKQKLVVLQVEGRAGIDALPEITDVDGAVIIFVGVYDLSQSLGVLGDVEHPVVEEALASTAARCRERGIHCGTFVESDAQAERMTRLGMHYLCYGVDVGMVADAGRGGAALRERLADLTLPV
jgi:4-hydroxy-2-oxoheptanedioate aldolase